MSWRGWSWVTLVGHRTLRALRGQAGSWEASVVSDSLVSRGGESVQGQQLPPFYSVPTESQQSKMMMNVGAGGMLETLKTNPLICKQSKRVPEGSPASSEVTQQVHAGVWSEKPESLTPSPLGSQCTHHNTLAM